MPLFVRNSPKYSSLDNVEELEYSNDLKHEYHQCPQKTQKVSKGLLLALFLCIPITSIATILVANVVRPSPVNLNTSIACVQPTIRREWRTLSKSDRSKYIAAVRCLTEQPSTVDSNGTAYDDFPWVHQRTAPSAHQSAPFLPWHRFYIHSYEKALKEQCAYTGALPYWDWSQDSQNFAKSPIWDADHGFGGDGATSGAETVGSGRCVENGPFAGLEALYYDDQMQPHCLSRGFAQGENLHNLTELIHPDVIEDLMREHDFEKFSTELERRAHRFVSHSINGDFSKYTGPYDPVFFLHHSNLDRLWATWQQKHDAGAYAGKANMLTDDSASVTDMLNIGGLMESVPVIEVMDTQSGMFCYQY